MTLKYTFRYESTPKGNMYLPDGIRGGFFNDKYINAKDFISKDPGGTVTKGDYPDLLVIFGHDYSNDPIKWSATIQAAELDLNQSNRADIKYSAFTLGNNFCNK